MIILFIKNTIITFDFLMMIKNFNVDRASFANVLSGILTLIDMFNVLQLSVVYFF